MHSQTFKLTSAKNLITCYVFVCVGYLGEYESTRNLQLSCEKNPPLYNDTTRIKNCQVVIPLSVDLSI